MSYQSQVEDLVGEHVARFQAELTLARQLLQGKVETPMPYGYPPRVYRPLHICRAPQFRAFIARSGGRLSNGVPRVLRDQWQGDSLLGIYNPAAASSRG
ncbi:MAG: hypothetical protein H7842_03710 [Gammaproteobacteria bacterium SHHR-1]|uniref:hypothetical protein n=1 Tax=Magnetovirga frankeli TaxID=947516 RepID=UPI001293C108|nr:hypothetical protein D5125_08825 [gamma proteobacterium SS-5]